MSQIWANQPYPLVATPKHLGLHPDPADAAFVEAASFMANLHNIMIRGLNSIYLQAPHIPPSDYSDFIGYCLAWCDLLEEHHSTEDTSLFVKLEEAAGGNGKSGMFINSEQHEAFQEPLARFHDYLKQALITKSFSGTHVQSLIDDFGPILHTHLIEEVDTLLALRSVISPEAITKAFADADREAKAKVRLLPALFLVMNVDDTYEDGKWENFLETPPIVLWILKHVVGRVVGRGFWKYASCGRDALPRSLYALQSAKSVIS